MKSIFSAVVIIVIAISSGFAQIPTGYYDNAAGLEGESLRDALRDIIKSGHTQNSYKSAKDLHNDFYKTDRKSNGKVWDMYSDIPGSTPPYEFSFTSGDQCGNYSKEGDCYNKEHSFPKSWFNEAQPAYADLFHLVPTDGYVNGIRNNFPFGENNGESYTSQNGSKKGACTYPGYGGICFEPIDDYKGDFARNYFYMATRYKDNFSSWADNTDMITGNNLSSWAINMLLEWHELDPVSTKEINRNNAVHDIQGNRNPYIDYPEWVECVWGSCDALQFTSSPVTDARENEAYSYSITYAVDIDDELLECTTKPSWLTFTPNAAGNSATLAGTPTVGSAGNASVVLTLTENGITATQNFTIVVVAASAPEFIFDKDFQDVSLTSGGWTAQNVTGNDHVWYVDTYDGSSYAKMSGHSYADFNNEDWLISPAVNMDDYEDEVFSFSSALKSKSHILRLN